MSHLVDVKKVIAESQELIISLRNLKNSLIKEIKNGDSSLYKKYIEVCSDLLSVESDLSKLKG